jgi:hypothetical protein
MHSSVRSCQGIAHHVLIADFVDAAVGANLAMLGVIRCKDGQRAP